MVHAEGYHPEDDCISFNETNTSYPNRYGSVLVPPYYSSVEQGYITAAKNQGSYDTCWAFSAINSAETSLIMKNENFTIENLNLSELKLAYFFYHTPTDPLGGTADDKTTSRSNYLAAGGNHIYTTFCLANWVGASDEANSSYDNASTYESTINELSDSQLTNLAFTDVAHLQNSYWISHYDTTTIKQMIQTYGCVSSACYYSNRYYNKDTNSYYCPISASGNHAISIVGWDDNYSIDHFVDSSNDKEIPQAKGAWLVKNSWGTSYGDNGYFWLSYEDANFANCYVYDFERADNYDNNYQYDGTFNASLYDNYEKIYIANVFTSQNKHELLKAVSFYTYYNKNLPYTIDIYVDLTDSEDPTSGKKVLSQSGVANYVGYHTIPLKKEILLHNNTFSVVVKFQNNYDYVYYLVDESYVASGNWIQFYSFADEGQSFTSTNNAVWEDISTDNQNHRIKAFTVNSPTSIQYKLNGGTNNSKNPTSFVAGKTLYTPTRSGYRFVGWYRDSSFKTKITKLPNKVTNNLTLYARWTSIPYRITYYLNGGTNHSKNPSNGVNTKKITLSSPKKKGYTFAGWYTSRSYTKRVTTIAIGNTSKITLYAKWNKVKVNKAKITSVVNQSNKKLVVKWNNVSNATGYQITYSRYQSFKKSKSYTTTSTNRRTLSGLTKKKYYYIKVRAYKIDSTGKKIYGAYSSVWKKKVVK